MQINRITEHGAYGDYGSWFVKYLAGNIPNAGDNASLGKHDLSCVILNDPNVYVNSFDKYASKPKQEVICFYDKNGKWGGGCDSYFSQRNAFTGGKDEVCFSYTTIANLDGSDQDDTTPLAFTRGLKTDGTWHKDHGVYGDEGGYVLFCDGHVTWFDGKRPAKFLKWDQSGYTSDIREALPNSAHIGNGQIRADYDGMILWGYGMGGE